MPNISFGPCSVILSDSHWQVFKVSLLHIIIIMQSCEIAKLYYGFVFDFVCSKITASQVQVFCNFLKIAVYTNCY